MTLIGGGATMPMFPFRCSSILGPPCATANAGAGTHGGSSFMKKIMLTRGQVALVDDVDFERFGHLKWCAGWEECTQSFTARRGYRENGKRKSIRLHRAIMRVTDPKVLIDHRNHDTLDCRRENLRKATTQQNISNRKGAARHSKSGVRGVVWNEDCKKWAAYIKVKGKSIYLGVHQTIAAASLAYWIANKKYFGNFGGA